MHRVALWLVSTLRRSWLTRRSVRSRAADGSELTLISMGDALDCAHLPRGKGAALVFPIEAGQARAMLGLLVRWWVFDAWFGIRLRLWAWAIARVTGAVRAGDRG